MAKSKQSDLPKIARRRSSVHGWGVFAAENISKNTRIIDYAGDGSANQSVSGTWKLAAGSYTVAVGGACYTCQYTEDPSTWGSNRVFSASLTLAPVPEPETWALTGAGLALMLLATRGRRAQR